MAAVIGTQESIGRVSAAAAGWAAKAEQWATLSPAGRWEVVATGIEGAAWRTHVRAETTQLPKIQTSCIPINENRGSRLLFKICRHKAKTGRRAPESFVSLAGSFTNVAGKETRNDS